MWCEIAEVNSYLRDQSKERNFRPESSGSLQNVVIPLLNAFKRKFHLTFREKHKINVLPSFSFEPNYPVK